MTFHPCGSAFTSIPNVHQFMRAVEALEKLPGCKGLSVHLLVHCAVCTCTKMCGPIWLLKSRFEFCVITGARQNVFRICNESYKDIIYNILRFIHYLLYNILSNTGVAFSF